MNPWTIRAPAKIVLFGEWAVLQGAPALATTLSSDFHLKVESVSSDAPFDFEISDLSQETLTKIQSETSVSFHRSTDPSTLPLFWQRSALLLKHFLGLYPKTTDKLSISTSRDWAISEGFGSSSALSACLLGFFETRNGETLFQSPDLKSRREYCTTSQSLKNLITMDGGSGIDICTQIMGQSVVYSRSPKDSYASSFDINLNSLQLKFPEELCLIHTGKKVDTGLARKTFTLDAKKVHAVERSVLDFLDNRDWEKSIRDHFEIFSQTPVVPTWIQDLRSDWKEKNLVHALKTTGAGGGDALLVWSPLKQRERLKKEVEDRHFWISHLTFQAPGVIVS